VRLEHVEITADERSAMDPHQPGAALLGTSIDAAGYVTVEPVNHNVPGIDVCELREPLQEVRGAFQPKLKRGIVRLKHFHNLLEL
jgi:hypothetical protein